MYINKNVQFDAFCSHLDEIETIPNDSHILSSNEHSNVQALCFKTNHAGGTLGGISTGQDIVVKMALKPTSSILIPGETITTKNKNR